MRVLVLPSSGGAVRAVAGFVARTLRVAPNIVLGLPTGRTMIPVYRELVVLHRRGLADFDRMTSFNLDEFVGLPPSRPAGYRAFMERYLFSSVNIREGASHFPAAEGMDADYDRAIESKGGLDLCIVGIGANGHLGFNEPGATLEPQTHRARLRPSTRRANAYLFRGYWRQVPKEAMSMGMGTILRARSVVLLATGRDKARIVRRALEGPITTWVPASFLQVHPNALVVLDRAAARELAGPQQT